MMTTTVFAFTRILRTAAQRRYRAGAGSVIRDRRSSSTLASKSQTALLGSA